MFVKFKYLKKNYEITFAYYKVDMHDLPISTCAMRNIMPDRTFVQVSYHY